MARTDEPAKLCHLASVVLSTGSAGHARATTTAAAAAATYSNMVPKCECAEHATWCGTESAWIFASTGRSVTGVREYIIRTSLVIEASEPASKTKATSEKSNLESGKRITPPAWDEIGYDRGAVLSLASSFFPLRFCYFLYFLRFFLVSIFRLG